jgi:glycolate oxidase FAD binding subunit
VLPSILRFVEGRVALRLPPPVEILSCAPMTPRTAEEFAEAVRSAPRVRAVGARTKPRLSQVESDTLLLSTCALSGIIEYEPSEFTFTALAGTPLREIEAALAAREQYLPFDPMLVEGGATLGGTVASGLSGPGRFRFGGVRDFILGIRFIDGMGRVLRMGGKVVKNAAGFDLPKFFVGSLGRFGVLVEITFKVFPRPAKFRAVRVPAATAGEVLDILIAGSTARWELDALDYSPPANAVFMRLGGPPEALDALTGEMLARWPAGTLLDSSEADAFWNGVREFRWAHADGVLAKFAITPKALPALCAAIPGARIHVSAGGNVAFVSVPAFDPALDSLGARGFTLRGDAPLWLGPQPATQIAAAVKSALDPQNRFP